MSTCGLVQKGGALDNGTQPWAVDCRVSLGNPMQLEEALVRHPRLRIWIMHAGFPYLEDTIAILSTYPHVYADLSALNWLWPSADFHGYVKALVDAGLGKRLMFASDQSVWPRVAIPRAIEFLDSATYLTHEQKRDIFCLNAARFLRVEKQLCDG